MAPEESYPWTLTEHSERYCQLLKSQQKLLRIAWDDLELTVDDQTSSLKAIALRAEDVWREALKHAENQRASVREQIEDAHTRTERIRGEMSDEPFTEVQVSQS